MKKIRLLILLGSILLLIFSSYSLSSAYSNVATLTYDGKSKSFSYSNTTNQIVFSDFTDMMPGDNKEETATITAKNISQKSNLFMNIKNKNILDTIDLKVYSNKELIFDSSKQDSADILIHTFTKDETIEISFVVSISTEVGNEVDEAELDFDVDFMIEEEGKEKIPATYDNGHIKLNILLLFISIAGIVISSKLKEKKIK